MKKDKQNKILCKIRGIEEQMVDETLSREQVLQLYDIRTQLLDELNDVKKSYEPMSNEELTAEIFRLREIINKLDTKKVIKKKNHKKTAFCPNKFNVWTEADKDFIKANLLMKRKLLARKLGRTKGAVTKFICTKIYKHSRKGRTLTDYKLWVDEDKDKLIALRQRGDSVPFIAKEMNIKPARVYAKLKRMNIK